MASSKAFSQTANNSLGNWQLVWSDEFNYKGLPVLQNGITIQEAADGVTMNYNTIRGVIPVMQSCVTACCIMIARKIEKEKNNYTSARLITKIKVTGQTGKSK